MRFGKQRHESRYLAIDHFYTTEGWSINWMCKKLKIARSSFYKWKHRTIPVQEQENRQIGELIKEYDERYCHILGYRRMTEWINYFNHTSYSKNRIHRMMKKLYIHASIRRKRKKYTTSKSDETVENVLERNFNAEAPNQKWATDVTEFKIPNSDKKLYLSAILDLYDRYPVSFVISRRNNNQLVFDTFDQAIRENPTAKPVFHSDRGFQYTSKIFRLKLQDSEMIQSMSRVGHCIDNGAVEGFWGIIKTEMFQMYTITDEKSLRYAITDYMRFYTEERPQSRYNCKTPSVVRRDALAAMIPTVYPIAPNRRIEKYKMKWSS